MKIYHYQETTGEFIAEGMADADPLEVGHWLIPAHATNIAPPDHVEGFKRNFIAGAWEYKEIPPPPPIEHEPVAQPEQIKQPQTEAIQPL